MRLLLSARDLVREGLIRFEDDQDIVQPVVNPDRMAEVLEEFNGVEDFTDFSDQAHAAFALDAVQLEEADDAAAARELGDW